ncbi:MAG: hypothetical protein AB8I69_14650 [Anaerolineae bacterium]|jgi:hypothetical protein
MAEIEKLLSSIATPLCIGFVGLFVMLGVISLWQRGKSGRAWSELTSRTGLTAQAVDRSLWAHLGSFRIERALAGVYYGRQVTVSQFRATRKKSRAPNKNERYRATEVQTQVTTAPDAWLRIQPCLALGKKSVAEISDEELERRFLIKSQPEGLAKQVLASQPIRQKLMALPWFDQFLLHMGRLQWEKNGVVTRVEDFERAMELVVDMANVVESIRV